MSFEGFQKFVNGGLGSDKEVVWRVPQNIPTPTETSGYLEPIVELFYRLLNEYPQAVDLKFHYPMTEDEAVYVEIGYNKGVYYNADYLFYDQYSLEELASPTPYGVYNDAGFPEEVMRMNYDTFGGNWWDSG
nr:hypothetical protein [Salegentibacter tibetensis]